MTGVVADGMSSHLVGGSSGRGTPCSSEAGVPWFQAYASSILSQPVVSLVLWVVLETQGARLYSDSD